MPEHAADMPPTRRVSVEEAARIIGITANAVRKRVERGTLRSARDGDTRYVILDDDMLRHADDMPTDQALMVTRFENEVEFLRELVRSRDEELRREREAREEAERRHNTIIMRMAERIPELQAPASLGSETRESTQKPAEEADRVGDPPGRRRGPGGRRAPPE